MSEARNNYARLPEKNGGGNANNGSAGLTGNGSLDLSSMHDPRKVAFPSLSTLLWLPQLILVPLVVLLEPLWARFFRSARRG